MWHKHVCEMIDFLRDPYVIFLHIDLFVRNNGKVVIRVMSTTSQPNDQFAVDVVMPHAFVGGAWRVRTFQPCFPTLDCPFDFELVRVRACRSPAHESYARPHPSLDS